MQTETLNETVCNMTLGFNIHQNQTQCDLKAFESVTQFCKAFSLTPYILFVVQTQALWVQRKIPVAVMVFVVSYLCFMLTLGLSTSFDFISGEFWRSGPIIVGGILATYEVTLVCEDRWILEQHSRLLKITSYMRKSVVLNKSMGLSVPNEKGNKSKWAMVARNVLSSTRNMV